MKTEREIFEEWYARKLSITAKKLSDFRYYDVYSCHPDSIRITEAWEAWQASANREGYKLVPLDSLNEVISCAVTYISDRCNADEAKEVYDHIDRLEEDTP